MMLKKPISLRLLKKAQMLGGSAQAE